MARQTHTKCSSAKEFFRMALSTKNRSSSSASLTKKRKAINYLANGNSLTAAEARSRFGIKNFRAMISSIKSLVENRGNWRIVTEETQNGSTRYSMKRVLLVNPTVDPADVHNYINYTL
jgi:isopenicillin N synthase-like dioxygenase